MSEMLCLNHICVSYGSRQILHGIDLSLQPGEFCALLGLNGSGKSTLSMVCAAFCLWRGKCR